MAVLGIRGTGSWSTDERPKNFREEILFLKPNTKASLMAFLGKLPDAMTDDAEFKWFQKGLPPQRSVVSGAQTNVDTTIELQAVPDATPAKIFKKGHAVRNERTDEVMWVTADPLTPFTSIVVARGKGSTNLAMNDGDGLLIVGSSHMEGDPVPTAITYDPTVVNNFCQIFRNVIFLTKTGIATQLRTGKPLREALRELVEIHGIELEKGFIWGTKLEDVTGAQPQRTTGGVLSFITSNTKDFSTGVSTDSWENFLQDDFKYGSDEKLCLCGNSVLTIISRIARNSGMIELVPTAETFGMNISRYVTPHGTLVLRAHPLFNENPTYKSWGIVIDPENVRYRYLRDTTYNPEVQNKGDDARKDEYLSECGLELSHESTHAFFKNASTFVP